MIDLEHVASVVKVCRKKFEELRRESDSVQRMYACFFSYYINELDRINREEPGKLEERKKVEEALDELRLMKKNHSPSVIPSLAVIQFALNQKDKDLFKAWVSEYKEIDAKEHSSGSSPIIMAAREEDPFFLSHLLQYSKVQFVDRTDDQDGFTPLLKLCSRQPNDEYDSVRRDAVELLLQKRADINRFSTDKHYTPLMAAVNANQEKLVNQLLQSKSIDINITTNKKKPPYSALTYALENQKTNLVELLLHHNAIPRQLDLQLAVQYNNEHLVGKFLEMKTEEPLNLNEALQTASLCSCESIAATLIRKGANPLSLPNAIRADLFTCLKQYSLSSEAGEPALLMNIQRLMTVCEAIERLRKNSESYLGIRNRVKAEKIETALQTQLERGLDNMDWKPVEDALKYHRIFGFFGFKNTKSMDDFKKVSTPSDSFLR